MGNTLDLCDCLMTMGRDLIRTGRLVDAARVLSRLAGFRELPAAIAEEVHSELANIALNRSDYRLARRHLTTAMIYRPSHAHYYYQYATAIHHDPDSDVSRAVRYYRQAQRLDPDEPRYWSDCGRLYLQLGRIEEGITALRKASNLSPDDPRIVAALVDGLCRAGREEEARTALHCARFRNRHDPRFRKLWNDFQFERLSTTMNERPAVNEPVILPFVRRAAITDLPNLPGRILRFDTGSRATPHIARGARVSDSSQHVS